MTAESCWSTLKEIYAKARFPLDFMPGGIQLYVVSGSVNTQM
jgi:hypothetical protein